MPQPDRSSRSTNAGVAAGIPLGLLLGGGLGMAVFDQLALGGGIGMLAGIVIGAVIDANAKR